MPVNPFSRYRDLSFLDVKHATSGSARSLPIRRNPTTPPYEGCRQYRISSYESVDLLALKYLSREELYWYLLDANDGRLPDSFEPGEVLIIPPLSLVTRIKIPGR